MSRAGRPLDGPASGAAGERIATSRPRYHARTNQFRLIPAWTGPADLGRWLEATAWWAKPDAVRTREQMAVELLEAVSGRFLGRNLTVEVGGTKVALHLDDVRAETDAPASSDLSVWWLARSAARQAARWNPALSGRAPQEERGTSIDRVLIEASSASIDDHLVGDVVATAQDVRMDYGTTTEIVIGPVELEVHSTRQHVVDWLARVVAGWQVALAENGLVAARPPGRRLTLLVRPDGVKGNAAVLDVVGISALGRQFALPRRLVRRIVHPLPTLPNGLELVSVALNGEAVDVCFQHPGLRLPIRPEHVRAAVREGVASLRLGEAPVAVQPPGDDQDDG